MLNNFHLPGLFKTPSMLIFTLILAIASAEFLMLKIIHDFVTIFKSADVYLIFSITFSVTLGILIALYFLFFRKMRQSEQEWDTMLELAADAIFIYNQQRHCIRANRAASEMLGYSHEEFLTFGMRDLVHPDDLKKLARPEEQARLQQLIEGKLTITGQRRLRRKDGSYITVDIHVKRLPDGRIISSKRDITARAQEDERIREMAFYDNLTHLPNRGLLSDRLKQAMIASKRRGCSGALMFLDLDNFKPLNDTHGHDVGDLLLIEASRRIQLCVREVDTVARFGGDEFVVLLGELDPDPTESLSQAKLIAEKICLSLAEPYLLPLEREVNDITAIEHRCTASIGVVLLNNNPETKPEDFLKWADKAMYQAKVGGGNQICFLDPLAVKN